MKMCSDVVSYGSNTLLAGESGPPVIATDVCLTTSTALGLHGEDVKEILQHSNSFQQFRMNDHTLRGRVVFLCEL